MIYRNRLDKDGLEVNLGNRLLVREGVLARRGLKLLSWTGVRGLLEVLGY